jgi:acetyl-CoA acyltransferase 2
MVQVLASQAAIQASGLAPEAFSSVCIGNVLSPSSPDAPYLARHVALRCGLPIPTPALIGNYHQCWDP